jgi:ribosomal protein L25 (general stress protein Ctc)
MEYTLEDLIVTEKGDTSTERVRRYYKRHPEKVKKYLKKTVKDRVARNRDRRKAVQKFGKSKVKNHDVHHPDGPNGGKWELAPKDHGRDTKDMKKARTLRKRGVSVTPVKPTGGKEPSTPKNIKFKAHNFKNLSLTFDEINDILARSLGEMLGLGNDITKSLKTETLKITQTDAGLRIVLNKSDIADIQKTGVSSKQFVMQYEGDPRVKTSITQVLVDIEKMLQTEKNSDLIKQIFGNGQKFLDMDIYSVQKNADVDFTKNVVIFKSVVSYNEDYKERDVVQNASKLFVSNLHKAQYTQDTNKHKNVFFSEESITDVEYRLYNINKKLISITQEYGLSMEDNLREYLVQVCDVLLKDLQKENNIQFTEDEFNNILYRWVDNEEFDLAIMGDEKKSIVREYELSDLKDDINEEMSSYQKVVLQGSVSMIQRINNTLVANLPYKKKIINDECVRSVATLNSAYSEDKDVYEELQKQLKRLKSIEIEIGIISFYYDEKVYLFTANPSFIQSNIPQSTAVTKTQPTQPGKATAKKTAKGNNALKGVLSRLFQQKTKVVNPATGETILLRTALGYGPSHPAYDAAREWLKNNIKGIPLLRDPEVAILRKRPKSKRGYNKYGYFE